MASSCLFVNGVFYVVMQLHLGCTSLFARPSKDFAVTVAPKVTVKDDVAAASVSEFDMSKSIVDAKTNKNATIVIAPDITDEANKISVELPKTLPSPLWSGGGGQSPDRRAIKAGGRRCGF